MVRMRKVKPRFVNNASVGAFVDVTFEIEHDTPAGPEQIKFDTKIHYLDKGVGETILLVHGIGQSLFTWRSNIDFFVENGYRVVAVDMAGFGYSDHPHIYYTIEENALILEAVLDALGIEKAHVIGFSTGALSALCMANSCPKKVGKLVLISPGGPNENYPFSMKFLTTWAGRMMARYLFRETAMRGILLSLFFDTPQVTGGVVEGYYDPFRDREVRETLAMVMMHYDDVFVRSLLKGTKQSVLVFSGQQDRVHDEKMIKAYAQNIPGAQHIRLRNCGHFVHEEKACRFNDAALEFLKADAADGTFV